MKNFLKENWFKIIISIGILLIGALFFYSYTLKPFFSNIVFQTVFAGTFVFVFGQIIQMFILEKINRYKKIIGKIDNRLKFYFKIIKNPGMDESIERSRVCSQELL